MQTNWKNIIQDAKAGNTGLFNQMVQQVFQQSKGPLINLTKSELKAWEVHIMAITKFWERFVLQGESLPKKNIEGYIFLMARNAFLDMKRKEQKSQYVHLEKIQLGKIKMFDKVTTYESGQEEHFIEEQEAKSQHLKSLEKAIGQLGDICKKIIEHNVYEKRKLKAVKELISYPGQYQAIVEKKKRCMKKLTKLFYLELSQNEQS